MNYFDKLKVSIMVHKFWIETLLYFFQNIAWYIVIVKRKRKGKVS